VKKIVPLLAILTAIVVTPLWAAPRSKNPHLKFDAKGNVLRPEGYRKWIFVGAPVTPNDMNGGKAAFPEVHHVYIDPYSFSIYERTGEFPQGTMLVKELTSIGTKKATSGAGYFSGEFQGLELAVKDAEHFANEPGSWAYFSFGTKPPYANEAKAHPTASCNGCHTVADQDYVFTQYYPVLRAAKK
jgi:hypothetical protein